MQSITTIIKNLPTVAGCYLFYGSNQTILYVGKAKQLRNRVRSYFTKSADLSPAKKLMVARITSIDYITVRTEEEALLLESTLIKKHKPPYNVILKDDKFFQYIKIVNEPFPRIIATRKRLNDGSAYFGPYSSAGSVKHTLKMLKRMYPFRTHTKHDFVFDVLKAGETISEREYNSIIKQVTKILKGDTKQLLKQLEKKMHTASSKRSYEQAAHFRDQITHLKRLTHKQQAIFTDNTSADIVHFADFKNHVYIAILKIRHGKIIDKLTAVMDNPLDSTSDVIRSFLLQYYTSLADSPKKLITPITIPDLTEELNAVTSSHIHVHTPQRGKYKRLLELAYLNAEEYARLSEHSFVAARDLTTALATLKSKLALKKTPKRIECFDISNVQGSHAVGSMVVFVDGKPDKSQYRKFSIKYTATDTPNDFAMMSEVLARRFRHPEWPTPDLVILDGGKGQLSAVIKTLSQTYTRGAPILDTIPIVSLAKKHEEIFIPEIGTTTTYKKVLLPKKTPAFFLVQRIRDEAHRFAITYYRLKHKKSYRQP